MRIAIVAENAATGYSGGRYLSGMMAEALALTGWETVYITNAMPPFFEDFSTLPGHKRLVIHTTNDFRSGLPSGDFDWVVCVPGGRDPGFYESVRQFAERAQARIALLNFESPNWFNALSPVPRDESEWEGWRWISQYAALIVSCAAESTRWAREYYRDCPPGALFRHCHPAINDAAADAARGVRREKRIALFMRFFRGEHKGAEEVGSILDESMRGYTLVIFVGVGDVPDAARDAIDARARECGVTVEYLRAVSDAQKFAELSRCRLLLFPSYFEGFGYPPVEAQYCGVPCVAFDLPVLREVSGDAIDYVPPGDFEAFRAAAAAVLIAPPDSDRLRDNVANIATLESYADRLIEIFDAASVAPPVESAVATHAARRNPGSLLSRTKKAVRDRLISATAKAALRFGKLRRLLRDVLVRDDAGVWRTMIDEHGTADIGALIDGLDDDAFAQLFRSNKERYRRALDTHSGAEHAAWMRENDFAVLRRAIEAKPELFGELLALNDYTWLEKELHANHSELLKQFLGEKDAPLIAHLLSEKDFERLRTAVDADAELLPEFLRADEMKYLKEALFDQDDRLLREVLRAENARAFDAALSLDGFDALWVRLFGEQDLLARLLAEKGHTGLAAWLRENTFEHLRAVFDGDPDLLADFLGVDRARRLQTILQANRGKLLEDVFAGDGAELFRQVISLDDYALLRDALLDNERALLRSILEHNEGRALRSLLAENDLELLRAALGRDPDLLQALLRRDGMAYLRRALSENEYELLEKILSADADALFRTAAEMDGRRMLRSLLTADRNALLKIFLSENDYAVLQEILKENDAAALKSIFENDQQLLFSLLSANEAAYLKSALAADDFALLETALNSDDMGMARQAFAGPLKTLLDNLLRADAQALFKQALVARDRELLREAYEFDDGETLYQYLASNDGAALRDAIDRSEGALLDRLLEVDDAWYLRDAVDRTGGKLLRNFLTYDNSRYLLDALRANDYRLLIEALDADGRRLLYAALDRDEARLLHEVLSENRMERLRRVADANHAALLKSLVDADGRARFRRLMEERDFARVDELYRDPESGAFREQVARLHINGLSEQADAGKIDAVMRSLDALRDALIQGISESATRDEIDSMLDRFDRSALEDIMASRQFDVVTSILNSDDYAPLRRYLIDQELEPLGVLFERPDFFLQVIQILFRNEMLLARLDFSRRWNVIRNYTKPELKTVKQRFAKQFQILDSRAEARERLSKVVCEGETLILKEGRWCVPDRNCVYPLLQEIFVEQQYFFETADAAPRILDCGTHCGLSVAYFKSLYPEARITGFEPVPELHALATENLQRNTLRDVDVLPVALAGSTEKHTLWINEADSMSASLAPGNPVNGGSSIKVNCVPLSDYLDEPVHMLKLDIEGAESAVLAEAKTKLKHVHALVCEYHVRPGPGMAGFHDILKLLQDRGFILRVATASSYREFPETRPLTQMERPTSLMIWGWNQKAVD